MKEPPAKRVIIALGTNKCHKENMTLATRMLGNIISDIKYSSEMWTAPIGMKLSTTNKFLNMIISGLCTLTHDDLHKALKHIEKECGRTNAEKKEGIIRMDIDILKYGDTKEHISDWQRNYIKTLIKDISI